MKRSDLFCENAVISDNSGINSVHVFEDGGTKYTIYHAPDKGTTHYTVFTESGDVCRCLTRLFGRILPAGRALVVGLGNKNISSDSLGCKTLEYVPATAHLAAHEDFSALGMREVCVMEAGVTGKTGMESARRIASAARCCGAELIVAVDSLACASTERLCRTVQISDGGISPGSGVGNDRQAVNRENCGVPVFAVGVPTVIDLDSFTDYDGARLMVAPRSIDVLTDDLARTVGMALSRALNPTLSDGEIMGLTIR